MTGHPIHIFVDTNGVKTPTFVNVGGHGVLQQDTVHGGIAIKTLDVC
jgi:hypothetical protein